MNTKKLFSLIMTVLMLGAVGMIPSFATDGKLNDCVLKADSDGNFKILQVADVQEHCSLKELKSIRLRTLNTIKTAVTVLNPDLIVLTGDNIHRTESIEDFDLSVKKLVSTFKGTPFAVTYGNHDLEKQR